MTNAEYLLRKYYGWWISLAIHGLVVLAFVIPKMLTHDATTRSMGSFVQVESGAGFGSLSAPSVREASQADEQPAAGDGLAADALTHASAGGALNPFGGGDTSGLKNYYVEKSLNVRIRYPDGWAFLDQPKNGKLDAVTFMGMSASTGEIPYIILEVKEKYLFNPSQFAHRVDKEHYSLFYNDPQILEQQVSQNVYVRTENNEDYSIKMIVKGEAAFRELQLAFFAMIETFRFGEMK